MGSTDRAGRHLLALLMLLAAIGAAAQHLGAGAAGDAVGRLACIAAVLVFTVGVTTLVARGPGGR